MSHALLSPSSAHRWLVCTPSARLEEQFPNESSQAADEGTLAHSFCETTLRYKLKQLTKVKFNRVIETLKAEPLFDPEMIEYAEDYANYVMEEFAALKAIDPASMIFIEQKLDFSEYVREGYGTGDTIMVGARKMVLVDYKHGKGVKVEATNNPQLKLYGIGGYMHFSMSHDIEQVVLHIYQPRIDNIDSFDLTAEELFFWAENYVKDRAAAAWEGVGEYAPGEKQCKFCAAKGVCRALAEQSLESVRRYDFKNADLLTDQEVSEILDQLEQIQNWIKGVSDHALHQAVTNQKKYPGYKLVEGRSNRSIGQENEAVSLLEKEGIDRKEFIVSKLTTVTNLEKLLGKKRFGELLGPYIVKPPGKPTLVPTFDPRPEWSPASADFAHVTSEPD